MEMYNFEYYKHPSQKDSTLNYPPSNYYSNTIPFYNNDGSFLGQQTSLNKNPNKETNNPLNHTHKGQIYVQQQAQCQRIASQNTLINLSNKNGMFMSEGRHITRYSFKRATSFKPQVPRFTLPAGGFLSNRLNSKDEQIQNRQIINEKEQTTNAFSVQKIQQLQARIRQQELLLTRIRDIAYNRKIECQRNLEKDYACISALIQIYNITIFNTNITPLSNIKVNHIPASKIVSNIQTNYIPNPINIVIPNTPVKPNINFLPTQTSPFYRPSSIMIASPQILTTSRHQSKPIFVPPQPVFPIQPKPIILPQALIVPVTPVKPEPVVIASKAEVFQPKAVPPKVAQAVDKSEQYLKQINELKFKIVQLQSQRLSLVDQIRQYQKLRFESSKSEQIIASYKSQIERLKQNISILSVSVVPRPPICIKDETQIEQLKQKLAIATNRQHEYEEQLIEAQNHIIYLQNQSKEIPLPSSNEKYQLEITSLRQTIAQYNDYIQSIQAEKQEFKRYIIEKQEEIHKLYQENNTLNLYIQQSKHMDTQNAVDTNQYYHLAEQYGKKSFQVIILFSQIERLQKKNVQIKSFLQKAEEYILVMSQQQKSIQINDKLQELQFVLEQELRKQTEIKSTYETEIHRLNVLIDQLTQQLTLYQSEINLYKIDINNFNIAINELNQQITMYQGQINEFRLQIERITSINLQLTQQISVYQTEITNYITQIKSITKPATIQGIDPDIYNGLVVDFGKKQLQVIILLEQINRLNLQRNTISLQRNTISLQRNEVLDHLKRAEDYIVVAQDYIKQLEDRINSHTNINLNQIEHYRLQIKELQSRLILLTQKIVIYESNQTSHLRQKQTLQLKYKQLLGQSDKKYEQWAIEKRSLVSQISILTQKITKITNANISIQKSLEFHQINKQLNIHIAEITQLLVNSQAYIRSNTEKWERVQIIEKQLTEQSSLIEILNREVQLSKSQNTRLNQRIIELQKVIYELNNPSIITTNQSISVIYGQKEEREVFEGNQQLVRNDNSKMKEQSKFLLMQNQMSQVLDNTQKDKRYNVESVRTP